MTSLLDVRQDAPPTLLSEPLGAVGPDPDDWVLLERVLDVAGLVLDPWQLDFLRRGVSLRPDGRFAAFEVAGVVPRQNGKGAIMEARQLAGLFVFGERLQVHTAHEFKTASEHFIRLKELIEGSPELNKHKKIIRTGSGDQSIELRNGCRIRFLARSRTSGRGFSGDAVYLDEAFELSAQSMGAILPTLSARPNPQVWYFSSAPHYTSEHLHALLHRADTGEDPSLLLAAWENPADVALDDMDAARRVNPALGHRVEEWYIANEYRALVDTREGRAEFRRERLGVREGGAGEGGVILADAWDALEIEIPTEVRAVNYGLAASGDSVCVGSAGRLDDGSLYVDSVRHEKGTKWVVPYLQDLYARKRIAIRVDPSGVEGMFVRPLREVGVEVVEVTNKHYQQACGELVAAVEERAVHHLGRRQPLLSRAAIRATRRNVGQEGGWVWDRLDEADDLSPLKAATLALTGVTARRAPRIHVLKES